MNPKVLWWVVLAGALVLPEALTQAQIVDPFNPSPNNMVDTAVPLPNGGLMVGGNFSGICGQTRNGLALLTQGGSLDASFTNQPVYTPFADGDQIQCVAIQTNGQIIIGGEFSRFGATNWCRTIARFNPDGTFDTQFDHGYTNLLAQNVNCLQLQPDGKIIVGVYAANYALTNNYIYRLNADGTLDTNFAAALNFSYHNNRGYSCALQPDGKVVILGDFTLVNNQSITNFARLNADGSLDSDFQPPAITMNGWANSPSLELGPLLLQPDGKILVGGCFGQVGGQAHIKIARFNADGSLDTSFNAQADFNCDTGVQSMALQTDGRIIVAHDSATFDGQPSKMATRLNADGTLDPTFSTNLFPSVGSLYSVELQADGKILLGGAIGSVEGLARPHLCRLDNTEPATQSLAFDGTNILWLRGGTSPEVWRTSFESSLDGTNWFYLGEGLRISGGWALSNVVASAKAMIRARGFVKGGRYNGSSWFVESVYPTTTPAILTTTNYFGWSTNQFAFGISGSEGSTVVVEESTNLVDWPPYATNLIYDCPLQFGDLTATNAPQRFYRLRLQ